MTDKGKILAFPDAAAVEAEAARWVARFDAGDVSAKEQAAFQEWLNRSALHREAIAVYGNLWSEFDALRSLTDTGETGPASSARDDRSRDAGKSNALACGLRGIRGRGCGRSLVFPPTPPGNRKGRRSIRPPRFPGRPSTFPMKRRSAATKGSPWPMVHR